MNLTRLPILLLLLIGCVTLSCSNDDDGNEFADLRDPNEVNDENRIEIETFLETHYFKIEENSTNENLRNVVFHELDEDSNESPVIESEFLKSKVITQQGVDYTLYYLKFREGNQERRKPTFADSVFVTLRGETIRKTVFEDIPNPTWLDNTQTIRGLREALVEFRSAGDFTENNDGTFFFDDDFGYGAVFIPSGVAYFAVPPTGTGIRRYEPIIFSFQLYRSRESDHDGDGIPSWMEDVRGTRDVGDTDTDNDGFANFVDVDDDGDGVLTRDEVEFDEDGNLILPFPDSNGNGTPDHLDPTWPEQDDN